MGPLVLDENVLARSDENVLKKRYVESLDELDRIALNVARSTLGSLFSLEKSNHYMEWRSAQKTGGLSPSFLLAGAAREAVRLGVRRHAERGA